MLREVVSRSFLFSGQKPREIFKDLYVTKQWHFWKSVLRSRIRDSLC